MKYPDYNTVYASLKTRQIDAWVAPSQQAQGTVQPGDPAVIIENTFSSDDFVAYAVAKDNKPLIDALNSGLDAVIADGTWARLYSDWVPRTLPPGWKPGSKAARDADGCRTSPRSPPSHHGEPAGRRGAAEVDTARNWLTRSSTGTCTGRRSPTCSRPACRTR